MPEDNKKILQNLKDAGCKNDLINKFFQSTKSNVFEQLHLLYGHRKDLLNKLHNIQKQIDCLDFLIFNLERQTK